MITRSVGGVAQTGHSYGSGYEGLTKELDDCVVRASELLQAMFPNNEIVIRFNSDRHSEYAVRVRHPKSLTLDTTSR
jgi:hypothetical protein